MVQPTPFDRLLHEVMNQANDAPATAFARLEELFGKSLTENDVLALSSLAANLGGAGLGEWERTTALLDRLLTHAALGGDSPTRRSVWRAKAVMLIGAGKPEEAELAGAAGISSNSEACRFAGTVAQVLCARNRIAEALPHLKRAAALCRELPITDEVQQQTALIATNLMRAAEPQMQLFAELALTASDTALASVGRADDWRMRHRARFHRGKMLLLAGRPTQALALVGELMALEDAHDAGPVERFFTANLACRAQAMRGQFKVAAGALEACQDFSRRVATEDDRTMVTQALIDLERTVAELKPVA